jgi:NAD(P) transhydrogenase subunit alpha
MAVTVAFVVETAPGERRAALSPETCKKFLALQARVLIERGAGTPAGFPDELYAGAEFGSDRAAIITVPTCWCACSRPRTPNWRA